MSKATKGTAKGGKVVCFFSDAHKFKSRSATFGAEAQVNRCARAVARP